jgi:hypothetical protein
MTYRPYNNLCQEIRKGLFPRPRRSMPNLEGRSSRVRVNDPSSPKAFHVMGLQAEHAACPARQRQCMGALLPGCRSGNHPRRKNRFCIQGFVGIFAVAAADMAPRPAPGSVIAHRFFRNGTVAGIPDACRDGYLPVRLPGHRGARLLIAFHLAGHGCCCPEQESGHEKKKKLDLSIIRLLLCPGV